jgi:hypothetical protein
MASPTARTLERLRRLGYTCGVVERRLPIAGEHVTQDFLGCIDVIAVTSRREPRVLGVQATSLSNLAARVAKARGKPGLAAWLGSGAAFQAWGWYRAARGRWELKIIEVKAGEVEPVVVLPRRRRPRRPVQPPLPGFD